MCDMLGNEPREDEIPIGRSDLCLETQMILNLYDKLQSQWEGYSGHYLGKDLALLPILFEEYKLEGYMKRYAWEIIPIIDSFIAKDVADKIKAKSKGAVPSGSS